MPQPALLVVVALLAHVGCSKSEHRPEAAPSADEAVARGDWILGAAEARGRLAAGALLIDVRGAEAYVAGHLEGAVAAEWHQFSEPGEVEKGNISRDDAALTEALRGLGLRADRPVVVVGDPVEGWGEDGRVVWMLRALGHPSAALVDGGHAALVDAGLSTTTRAATQAPGDFVIRRTADFEIGLDALLALVRAGAAERGELVIVDARERREYDGETPYGEARGGHLPAAVHLHYRELLDPSGYLLGRGAVTEKLEARGVTPVTPVVVYCTGGVRSGWFVAVLGELGYGDVRNYAGSMWEWAAGSPTAYPLE